MMDSKPISDTELLDYFDQAYDLMLREKNQIPRHALVNIGLSLELLGHVGEGPTLRACLKDIRTKSLLETMTRKLES